MLIFTLNNGSSSFKFQIYNWDEKVLVCSGMVERIGESGASQLSIKNNVGDEFEYEKHCDNHEIAINWTLEQLTQGESAQISSLDEIEVVGHRVVHGGENFKSSTLINDEVMANIRQNAMFAPLHNPVNLVGIEVITKILPQVPQVAIPDTAWHHTMPAFSYMYALPYEWYEKYSVRRYGFHGTSYLYTSRRAARLLNKKVDDLNLIICHIGNGASMCAVKNGRSYDTSMGLTPLEGLVMGTRSGDLDPAILELIAEQENLSVNEITNTLNKKSGIVGITGGLSDRRDVENEVNAGNERAKLALELECQRIKKYIGAYFAALGRVDAIIFTAGVGEMSATYREKSLEGLEIFNIKLDLAKNKIARTRNAETKISTDSSLPVLVIPTDEELVMTEDCYAIVKGTYAKHTEYSYCFEDKNYKNKTRDELLAKELIKKPQLADIILSDLA